MRARVIKAALVIIFVSAIYWSATAVMIENSARSLSARHSHTVWIPFDHTGFLISMGQRSVPALRRQLANPQAGMSNKIHLAWVLCRLGDYSRFQVFISGLKSERHQYMAVARMQDFPQECLHYLPAILAAARQKQHPQYWGLLTWLAHEANLTEDRKGALSEIISTDDFHQKAGLTDKEIQQISQIFGVQVYQQQHSKPLHSTSFVLLSIAG